jgi:hypothetical protein
MSSINTIDDLQPNPRNHNKGTERGSSVIEKSIRKLGAGRSGLCDKNGVMLGGNHALEKMNELGIPVKIIPTDGTEWVVVQRTDLDLERDKKAIELSYADNRTAELNLDYDTDQLRQDIEQEVDLSYLWSEKELDKKLGKDDRESKQKVLKIKLTTEQWELVTNAIAETSLDDNGDAIAQICQKYLDTKK